MKIFTEFHTIIAIYFYILLLVFAGNRKRLNLLTTKIFYLMIGLTNINLVLDISIFFATKYSDVIPYEFGVAAFKLYFISCMMVFSTHFIYIKKMCVRKAGLSLPEIFLIIVPTIVVTGITIVTDLDWYPKGNFIRIDSIAIYAIFAITMFYSIGVAAFYIRYWKTFSRKIKIAEILTAITWGAGFLSQLFTPVFLDMIGTSIIALMYIYFFYFENTTEIVDEKTGFFNKRGFRLMSEEYFNGKEEFRIINIGLEGLAYIRNQFGNEYADSVLKNMEEVITQSVNEPVFLFKENDLILLILHNKKEEVLTNIPAENLSRAWNVNGVNVKIKAKIKILKSELIKDKKDVFPILHFITSPKFNEKETEDIIWINEDILKKEEREQKILTLLQHAIVNDGFDVFYQPIFDAKSGSFASAEALVRLKDTQTVGFVSPEEFITIAEENGIIKQIGHLVFRNVCKMLSDEKLLEKGIHYIEVNLSAKEAIDGQVADGLVEEMEKYHLPLGCINLEVTETASVTSKNMLQDNMKKLREKKFTFSMDDFGTGYSNLAQIAELGYDIIKLDKSLIWPCFEGNGSNAMIILKNIIMMIYELGMTIVAEGIETEEQADQLIEFGVMLHQGYFYSKPLPEKEFISFIQEKNHAIVL